MSYRMRVAALLTLGLALLAAGAVLWLGDAETEFGWFSYAPLADQPSREIVFMTARRQAAVLVSSVGLVLLSGLAGFVLGRRSRRGVSA